MAPCADAPTHHGASSTVKWFHDGAIEGVTISGGEPLHQAPVLYRLLRALKAVTGGHISIGIYTGYTARELENGDFILAEGEPVRNYEKAAAWYRIRSMLDFAVMGRYNRLTPSDAPLCSSSNQLLYLYGGRYGKADFLRQQAEIHISEDGMLVQLTGFPAGESSNA